MKKIIQFFKRLFGKKNSYEFYVATKDNGSLLSIEVKRVITRQELNQLEVPLEEVEKRYKEQVIRELAEKLISDGLIKIDIENNNFVGRIIKAKIHIMKYL